MRLRLSFPVAFLVAVAASADPLTREEVVRLVREGTPDDAIVARIRTERPHFTLTVEEMLRLSRDGVSTAVLQAMMSPPAPAPEAAPAGISPVPATGDAFASPAAAPSGAGGNRFDFRAPEMDRLTVPDPLVLEQPRPGWMLPILYGFSRCLADRDPPYFRNELDPYRGRRSADRPYAFWDR